MVNIFYAKREAFPSSSEMLKKILNERFSIFKYDIFKNENGKPFLVFNQPKFPLFFSVSHTPNACFIAFSEENIGIDAELSSRKTNYAPILQKFTDAERSRVQNDKDFLLLWTAKEAAIKWLGGTIAKDLKKLVYTEKGFTLSGLELPLQVAQIEFFEHIISICSENLQSPSFHKV